MGVLLAAAPLVIENNVYQVKGMKWGGKRGFVSF